MRKLALAAAVVLLASVAHADSGDSTSYVYTGNQLSNSGNPNTLLSPSGQYVPGLPSCTCSITGEMTFAQALDLPTDIETVTGIPTPIRSRWMASRSISLTPRSLSSF